MRPPEAPVEPVYWRFLASPASTMQFVYEKRPSVGAWTVDRSGRAQPGDPVLLYGTGRLQSYVAIGRVCSPSVQNDKAPGRRLKKNREWWAYLQLQALAEPVARTRAEALPNAQRVGSGLQQPHGARANRVDPDAGRLALELLTRNDPRAAKRLDNWLDGKARWPRDLDLEELRYAAWEDPDSRPQPEIELCKRIAARLVREGRFRYLEPDDGVGAPPKSDKRAGPWALSLEHPISDEGGRGRVDILLVDGAAGTPTLLAIEVKLRAGSAARNPIPQILRYRGALNQRDGARWRISSLVVAEHFSELVKDQASVHRVPISACKVGTGRLISSLPG